MDHDNYLFRYDAYKNNTFNLDVVEKSLDESKMCAYQYLREFQLHSTGYKRFDFKMQDIYRTNKINHSYSYIPRRWVFYVEHEFISVGRRLEYKRSDLYEKDLSYDDVISRPDIFDSTFLVFIDGCLYTKGVKVLCKEDKTYLILICKEEPSPDGFPIDQMREYVENNVDVTIFFIPNVGIRNYVTNAYRVKTSNNGDGIPERNLNLSELVDYNNALSFINHVDTIYSLPTNTTLVDNGLYIEDKSVDYFINVNPTNTVINIQLIPLRNLLTKIKIGNGEKWFTIPMQDYPVAIENCLVFDADGTFIHKAEISHYYPNVYCINNVDDIINDNELYIYVFYYENKQNVLKHLDMLSTYHKYVPDYLEKYKNGTVSDIVKNFVPQIVDYSIKDYRAGLACNESVPEVYIKNSDDKIHKITIKNMNLITEPYDGDDKNDSPRYFKVRDMKSMQMYKIGMENGLLYTEPINVRTDDKDIVCVYDDIAQSHTHLSTESGVLSLFEWIHYLDHFRYKIDKMKEFIRADVNNFRRYLRNLGLGNNYYYVDVSKIDLTKRIRKDNADTKLGNLTYKEFDQDMYMFVFRNDFRGMYDNLIVHVDGIKYDSMELFRTTMLDYLYIPCDLVKPDSILEIEKITQVMKEYKFMSQRKSDIVIVDIGEFAVRNKTLYNDLFVVDEETDEVIDPDCYQLIIPVTLHAKDIESNVALDYIISESNNCYYYLKGLEYGEIELIREDNIEDENDSFYLRSNDGDDVYQFDVINDNTITFNKVKSYENIISRIRSVEDSNIIYNFKVVDGEIKIEVLPENEANAINSRQMIGYAGLDIIDLGEVFLPCKREVKIKITDSRYIGKNLTLQIRKNFKRDVMEPYTTEQFLKPFNIYIDSKHDPRYYKMYRNGKLVPRHAVYTFFKDRYRAEICPGFQRNEGDIITIECMPYMMTQICYLEHIPNDQVIDLTGLIDKPFDLKWHEVYLNGKKLNKNDIEILTANKIKVLKTDSLRWLEIVENSRDKEYFGYKPVYDILDYLFEVDKDFADNVNNSIITDDLQNTADPVIDDIILLLDYILRAFYEYLVENFGFINPDWLQISSSTVETYKDLMGDDRPFELNPDRFGKIQCPHILPINPDDNE